MPHQIIPGLKKVVALSLLILFSFNSIGFYVVFGIQLYKLKAEVNSEIANGMFDQELVTVTSNAENALEFDWKNSGEFRYRGRLYDVVKTVRVDESITTYVCKKDSEESDLFDSLEKQLHKNNKRDKRNQKSGKVSHKVFYEDFAIVIPRNNLIKEVRKMSFLRGITYRAPHIPISSPPPQLV